MQGLTPRVEHIHSLLQNHYSDLTLSIYFSLEDLEKAPIFAGGSSKSLTVTIAKLL